MQQPLARQLDSVVISAYIHRILLQRDNPVEVQNIIVEAAKAGVLPFLHDPDSGLEVFAENDPEKIKVGVAERLLTTQKELNSLKVAFFRDKRESLHTTFISSKAKPASLLEDTYRKEESELYQSQDQLILEAFEKNLLPSEQNFNALQDEDENSDRVKESVKQRLATILQKNQTPSSASQIAIDQVELPFIFSTLKKRNHLTFKVILQEQIKDILSRDERDVERKILIRNLQKTYLHNLGFVSANFEGANLEGSVLKYFVFQSTNFKKSNVKNACLKHSEYKYCDFTGSDLEGTDFSDGNLTGSIFKDANLQWVNLTAVNFLPNQILDAFSLCGIYISDDKLEQFYSPEDRKNLQEKLVADYEKFFKTSEDIEKIVKMAFEISPYVNLDGNYFYKTFDSLNRLVLIHECPIDDEFFPLPGDIGAYNSSISSPLLKIAYKRLLFFIETGKKVTKGALIRLNTYKDIFKYTNTIKIKTLLEKIELNEFYHECIDYLDSNLVDNNSIEEDVLVSAFDKIFLLFQAASKRKLAHFLCNKAFDRFNEILAALYQFHDKSRIQTLVSLFLGKPLDRLNAMPEFSFHLAEALFSLKGAVGFYSEKQKWQLILSFLISPKDDYAKRLQAKAFLRLQRLNNPGLKNSSQSLAEMVGVDEVVSIRDLMVISIDDLGEMVDDLSALPPEGLVRPRSSAAILKQATIIENLYKSQAKTIAIYEQLVIQPENVQKIKLEKSKFLNFYIICKNYEIHCGALRITQQQWVNRLKNFFEQEAEQASDLPNTTSSSASLTTTTSFVQDKNITEINTKSVAENGIEDFLLQNGNLYRVNCLWYCLKSQKTPADLEALQVYEAVWYVRSVKLLEAYSELLCWNEIQTLLLALKEASAVLFSHEKSIITTVLIQLEQLLEEFDRLASMVRGNSCNLGVLRSCLITIVNTVLALNETLVSFDRVLKSEAANFTSVLFASAKNKKYRKSVNDVEEFLKQLTFAQSGLYAAVGVSISSILLMSSLSLCFSVALWPYLAIPGGIGLFTVIPLIAVLHEKEKWVAQKQRIEKLKADSSSFGEYVSENILPPVKENVRRYYRAFFSRGPESTVIPSIEGFLGDANPKIMLN